METVIFHGIDTERITRTSRKACYAPTHSDGMFVVAFVSTFGPFLIPVVLFGLGVVGYLFIVALSRLRG